MIRSLAIISTLASIIKPYRVIKTFTVLFFGACILNLLFDDAEFVLSVRPLFMFNNSHFLVFLDVLGVVNVHTWLLRFVEVLWPVTLAYPYSFCRLGSGWLGCLIFNQIGLFNLAVRSID